MQINKILEYAAFAVGGISLFLASLLVFALAAGVPAHDVAIIGGLFPEPPPPAETSDKQPGEAPARPKIQPKSLEDVIASTLSRLPGETLSSPFPSDELGSLVGDLKRLKLQYETDLEDLTKREDEVAEREAAVAERAQLLQDLMAQLDQREGELALREDELKRDEKVASENEMARWKSIARTFADGDASKWSKRLIAYGAEDAAKILSNLDPDRATELLDQIDDDTKFIDFNDAYAAYAK